MDAAEGFGMVDKADLETADGAVDIIPKGQHFQIDDPDLNAMESC